MADRPLFSRDEVLGGLPARRASALLFAVESRTATLVARSRRALATYETEASAAEKEQAWLAALAAGREPPLRPTIRDIERYAPEWAALVPESADLRAVLARMLGAKYRFTRPVAPRIRRALGLDTEAVAAAFERLHGRPLDSIYATDLGPRERISWMRARVADRLEHLPPFWMAYALTLTETFGEGILAVPIALAGLGPLPGVVLLIVLGLVNLVTLGALVEAITRNGSMRYGTAYFSRLVRELLGSSSAATLGITLLVFNVVTFLTYLLGFAAVLTGATGIPAGIWVAVLFAVNVIYLRRESLDATVASAIVIGVVNIGLIVAISLIALANAVPANLTRAEVPFGDDDIDPTVLQLVFGVVLMAFFGHTSAANAAKVVLAAEPTGRALLLGNLAALATVIALYCLGTVAILGVLGAEPLAGHRGTALEPLAERIGPVIDVLGSLYVILAIGLGSIFVSLGLFNQAVEVLATRRSDRRTRRFVGIGVPFLVFVWVELLLLGDLDSFTGPIAIAGVLAVPLLAGVFPMLMLAAARRKGEYVPGVVVAALGHPVVVGGVSALFLGAVLLHGLVIWSAPGERAAALLAALVIAVLVGLAARSGAFRARTVLELRREPGADDRGSVTLTAAGRRLSPDIRLVAAGGIVPRAGATWFDRASDLREVHVTVPAAAPRDLRVWAHAVDEDGHSRPAAVALEVAGEPGDGRVGLPPGAVTVTVRLAEGLR